MATQLEINEITSLYEDILFRAPDPGGLAYWAGQLDGGALSLTQITGDLVGAAEALNVVDPIVRLYQGLFSRAPDFDGLQHWVALADSGTSFDSIVQGFVGSTEFADDYNNGVAGPIARGAGDAFVTALYEHMLDRAPDAIGLDAWLGLLGKPTIASEAQVIEGIVNSPEYIADSHGAVAAYETNGAVAGLATTDTGWVGDEGSAEDATVTLISINSVPVDTTGPLVLPADAGVVVNDPADTSPTTSSVSLGPNDTVALEEAAVTLNLSVTGDVTGATSAVVTGDSLPEALVHETITWTAGNLNLTFGNEPHEALAGGSWTDSQVNPAPAVSLAGALDIAAGQAVVLDQNFAAGQNSVVLPSQGNMLGINANTGLVDWFRYGGNTYIVEANNNSASAAQHTALGTHDAVIEIIGLVDPGDIGDIGFNHG